MGALRDFVADMLESEGAAIEPVEPDGLEVLAPEPAARRPWAGRNLRGSDLAPRCPRGRSRSDSKATGSTASVPFWASVAASPSGSSSLPTMSRRRAIRSACSTARSICPTQSGACMTPNRRGHAASCLRSATPPSPTKSARDWSGSASTRVRARSWTTTFCGGSARCLASVVDWQVPDPDTRRAAGVAWVAATVTARVEPLVEHHVRLDLEPFLNAMRRRLDRDRGRVHAYHDDLRRTAQLKLAALGSASGEKAEADRKRETLRIAAIEREYAAKLDDLRHNYDLRVTVDWVQGLTLFAPVHRYDVLIKRRKGERTMRIDWHPAIRMIEPPPSDWGLGIGRARLVCDDHLHLTDPSGQAPCPSCGKAWCRACHSAACPRCGQAA